MKYSYLYINTNIYNKHNYRNFAQNLKYEVN